MFWEGAAPLTTQPRSSQCPQPQIHPDAVRTLNETLHFVVVALHDGPNNQKSSYLWSDWHYPLLRVTCRAETYGAANVCQFLPTEPAISSSLLTYSHTFKTDSCSMRKLL